MLGMDREAGEGRGHDKEPDDDCKGHTDNEDVYLRYEFGHKPETLEVSGLWRHAIDPYFNLELGVRHDFRPAPQRTVQPEFLIRAHIRIGLSPKRSKAKR